MLRKWLVFAASALALVAIAGAGFGLAADDENELEHLMENVNKHSNAIKKGTRNPVQFKKSQKDVAKSAKELVKLAKESKGRKEALGKAKNEADPQKKWNDLTEAFIGSSEKLSEVAGKASPNYDDTKKAFSAVSKTCTECHQVFRVDENF